MINFIPTGVSADHDSEVFRKPVIVPIRTYIVDAISPTKYPIIRVNGVNIGWISNEGVLYLYNAGGRLQNTGLQFDSEGYIKVEKGY